MVKEYTKDGEDSSSTCLVVGAAANSEIIVHYNIELRNFMVHDEEKLTLVVMWPTLEFHSTKDKSRSSNQDKASNRTKICSSDESTAVSE